MRTQLIFTLLLALASTILLASTTLEARTVTLRCSAGYSINVTIELHLVLTAEERERGDPTSHTETLSCPPDQTIELPDDAVPYDGLHAEWDMTDPNGNTTDGSLPAAPAPGDPPPGRYAVWGVHPSAPASYLCNSRSCIDDPVAPTFVQQGEFTIGSFDRGTTFDLITRVFDANTSSPVRDALVSVRKATDSNIAASGITDVSGVRKLTMEAGETYYIHVEAPGYGAHQSDSFQLLSNHEWRILMVPSSATSIDIRNLFLAWPGWLLIALVILVIVLVARLLRSRP